MYSELDGVEIRPATDQDARSIAQVHLDSWRQAYTGIIPDDYLATLNIVDREKHWAQNLKSPEQTTLIALANNRAIGFATLAPCGDEDLPASEKQLTALYLDPESWGRGVAKELMYRIFEAAGPTCSVSLWVISDNERAQHFYRRHGFTADGAKKQASYGQASLTLIRYRKVVPTAVR